MNDSVIVIDQPLRAPSREKPPWGFWATLVWSLLAVLLSIALVAGAVLWLSPHTGGALEVQDDPWFPLQFIAFNLIQIAVLAWAAHRAGWPVGGYFGLFRPSKRDLVIAFVALVVMMTVLEILTHVLGRESVAPFQTDSYRAARAAGLLPLMWVAFVAVAPVGEEIAFRGFVFRGWAASPIGPAGAILLTSLIFSAGHTQYDWFGTFQTFCLGTLFGWLRWRTGSTVVTILLHTAINFVATLWSALKVEGFV